MKILFVLENYYPNIGGVERLFRSLAEELVRQGHEATVFTTLIHPDLAREEMVEGVRIIRTGFRSRYMFTFATQRTLKKLAAGADIIHTTSYNAAWPAFRAAKSAQKPSVITFHEVWTNIWDRLPVYTALEKRMFKGFEKKILRLAFDAFVGVSEYTANALKISGIPEAKIHTIYNGLPAGFPGIKHHPRPGAFRYAYFGRLGASKGLELLIPAAARFNKEHPGSELFLVVPDVPARFDKWLNQLIKDAGENCGIRRIPSLPDEELFPFLASMSCVVIPSMSEGFCFAAAEVCACGIPVISSGEGALKETVSGKYIEMESFSTESLYKSLKQAAGNEWKSESVKLFSIEKAVADYIRLYERIESEPR